MHSANVFDLLFMGLSFTSFLQLELLPESLFFAGFI